jgi:hypothetical protein
MLLAASLVAVAVHPQDDAGRARPDAPSALLVVGLQRHAMVAEGGTLHGHRVVAALPALDAVVVELDRDADPAAARRDLQERPEVRYAEPDGVAEALATPNDPRYPNQYGPRLMGVPAAWDGGAGYGAASVKVAVIDSGLDRAHPDLAASRVLVGYDYVHRDGTPEDDCGHGTAVAGIVAATTNNGVGLAGIAQATLLPLKVTARDASTGACTGSMANVARAVTDATDQGAKVINLSLAATSSDSTTAAAIKYARDRGVVVVAGSGNNGQVGIKYPASDPNALAIGAVDASKTVASWSNRGPQLDFVAPGVNIDVLRPGSAYGSGGGTSYSAPHVAGAVALALACAPTLDAATLVGHLQASAEDLGAAGRDDTYGHGLVRADRLLARTCPGTVAVGGTTGWPPAFTVSSGSNEWWVDVRVQGGDPVRVDAVADGVVHALAKTSWGTWAASFHAVRGTMMAFTAANAQGQAAASEPMAWLGPAPAPAPAGPFAPTFTPKGMGNAWWVEVTVSASEPVAKVTATVGATAYDLPRTDWGTWARSVNAPKGTQVVFTAVSGQGATATSVVYAW